MIARSSSSLGEPHRDRPGGPAVRPDRAQAGHLRRAARSARSASLIIAVGPERPGRDRRRGAVRRVAGDVPRGRLGADDRHHPEGLVGPVHGPLERRDGVVDDDRGRDRRAADRPRQPVARASGAGRALALLARRSATSSSARCCCGRSSSPTGATARRRQPHAARHRPARRYSADAPADGHVAPAPERGRRPRRHDARPEPAERLRAAARATGTSAHRKTR